MKHFAKVSFFAVLMLTSAVQANPVMDMANEIRDTSAYYVEHMLRLAAVIAAGEAVQRHLPTDSIEKLFEFADKLPYVKEHNLRRRGAKVVWGAALIAAVRQLTRQHEVKRTLREAPALDRLIDWLLDFRAHKNSDI